MLIFKLDVKHRAAFRCCRRQTTGVEIHHIVPEPQGGPGTIDNAAPLCAKHHADFGDNPHKRKVIREMRDW
ncbi:MAG: HNH endonuclease [Syntrophobacteraceae bacterium]